MKAAKHQGSQAAGCHGQAQRRPCRPAGGRASARPALRLTVAPKAVVAHSVFAVLLFCCSAALALTPSDLAKHAFQNDGGFSFRVRFNEGLVSLGRTSYALPRRGKDKVMPAYVGATLPIFDVVLGPEGTKRVNVQREWWDHQVAEYDIPGAGKASVIVSRLTPAVLIDSAAKTVTFRGPDAKDATKGIGPQVIAFVDRTDLSHVFTLDELDQAGPDDFAIGQPWVLGWFRSASPYRNYAEIIDVDDPQAGAGFAREEHPMDLLDLPILFRLEHKPTAIRRDGNGVRFEFKESVGKIAVMPAWGGQIMDPELTGIWRRVPTGVPRDEIDMWAKALRFYPLTVTETFDADPAKDVLAVKQAFSWIEFKDQWATLDDQPTKHGPIPPMLATAIGSKPWSGKGYLRKQNRTPGEDAPPDTDGLVLDFYQDGQPVLFIVKSHWMDTPGQAHFVIDGDYAYHVTGLSQYLDPKAEPAVATDDAKPFAAKLERHVQEMIDAGHLAPLFYVYGGIGGARPAYFYWGDSAELARTLAMAMPYLSPALRQKAVAYLRSEWMENPPFDFDFKRYRRGANRAPYDVPWDDIGRDLTAAQNREESIRRAHRFADLYGVAAYYALTGDEPDEAQRAALRDRVNALIRELLAVQDWALMTPVRPHDDVKVEFITGAGYDERNGQAATNGWIAGAIGTARLAKRFGWPEEEKLAWYLFGKLALARIGQARYTAELHRVKIVNDTEFQDYRTLVHIDRRAAIVLRGSPKPTVYEDQELPPFIDLVPEEGRLLGTHASLECRIYLSHLDGSMPLWWVSEAPKQSASEQRLCPLQYKNGNVLAERWIAGKRGDDFTRYVDTTRFTGDLYYIQNLVAAIECFEPPPPEEK
jgi:hypothetical protein